MSFPRVYPGPKLGKDPRCYEVLLAKRSDSIHDRGSAGRRARQQVKLPRLTMGVFLDQHRGGVCCMRGQSVARGLGNQINEGRQAASQVDQVSDDSRCGQNPCLRRTLRPNI
ncbi:hypothetical protein BHM03_00006885 [Ensete ventricosum]|nr:hypothetical protein BHM03_00006885 [Ensete ventricosum]